MWSEHDLVASWLPVGEVGEWSVVRAIIEGDPALHEGYHERGLRQAGVIYTELHGKDGKWMSDDPDEFNSTAEFCKQAHGHVLITGLGLGVVPAWLLRNAHLASLTIIEKNAEVAELVWPNLKNLSGADIVKIVSGDAWNAVDNGQKYDVALHDFWQGPPTDADVTRIGHIWSPCVTKQFIWRGNQTPLTEM